MESVILEEEALEQPAARVAAKTHAIPLYLYATVLASFSIVIGIVWDLSWHLSIGRDGIFSPPHQAIYFGSVLAGIYSGFCVLKITIAGTSIERASSIKFWGIFYGSLGNLLCIWGALTMLVSAPFDDWWHNTYGLDVTLFSPPHTVLLIGMVTIQFGALTTAFTCLNRLTPEQEDHEQLKKRLYLLCILSCGFMLTMLYTITQQFFARGAMHSARFYAIACIIFPVILVSVSIAGRQRWGATSAVLVYLASYLGMMWILSFIPAKPGLSPVLNPITHFQQGQFPLLLLVPALAIDTITRRFQNSSAFLRSILYATLFLVTLLLLQWPFGDFLMSPYARNRFFGAEGWGYDFDPAFKYRYAFRVTDTGMTLAIGLTVAWILGFFSSRAGITMGTWMRKIQR
jgi:hypothetical protein